MAAAGPAGAGGGGAGGGGGILAGGVTLGYLKKRAKRSVESFEVGKQYYFIFGDHDDQNLRWSTCIATCIRNVGNEIGNFEFRGDIINDYGITRIVGYVFMANELESDAIIYEWPPLIAGTGGEKEHKNGNVENEQWAPHNNGSGTGATGVPRKSRKKD